MSDACVIIFEHGNYEGASQLLRPGYYNQNQLQIGGGKLSSLRVPEKWKVTLFAEADFMGEPLTVEEDTPSLKEFNDKAMSIRVERPWPLLRRGSKQDEVMTLQNTLIKLGHKIDADGIFGKGTEAAVEAFRKDNNIKVDGIVGKDTWWSLLTHMP
jgi:hypothetical protein